MIFFERAWNGKIFHITFSALAFSYAIPPTFPLFCDTSATPASLISNTLYNDFVGWDGTWSSKSEGFGHTTTQQRSEKDLI
jgi:hypothetical protein